MSEKPRHLSKTDLRRGLFTKAQASPPPKPIAPAPAPEPVKSGISRATSAAEQALLFDLSSFDAPPRKGTRTSK